MYAYVSLSTIIFITFTIHTILLSPVFYYLHFLANILNAYIVFAYFVSNLTEIL